MTGIKETFDLFATVIRLTKYIFFAILFNDLMNAVRRVYLSNSIKSTSYSFDLKHMQFQVIN